MAQDTERPNVEQQQVAADHIPTNPHQAQDLANLRVSTNDLVDHDTSDPVREKLKKTSIATLPKTDTAALPLGSVVQHGSPVDLQRPPQQQILNQTPSPTSESRGRLSRKRSYDDSIDTVSTAAGHSSKSHQIEDDAKHTRKRSRDVRAVQPQGTRSAATPLGESLLEREASSDEALGNDALDQEMEDSIYSPRKKRSREDIDTEHHRGQKIAATDEAKAHRHSEESERSQLHPQDDGAAAMTDSNMQEKPQTSVVEAANPQQVAVPTRDIDTAHKSSPPKAPQAAEVDQKGSSKTPTNFATSGFAAMSGSSTSPFGAFGTPTTSVFGSKPATNFVAAGTASPGMNGTPKMQTGTANTLTNSASPFVNSTSANATSGFGINGAASKLAGFGGSVFGSGFGNPAAGAPRLSSFAAPTSDVAVPKVTESKPTFGALADDSAEEDGGSEDDTNPEGPEARDDETDSRFQQQEIETGEAGEESIFVSPRALLYGFDGGWKEKGRGAFKLNVSDIGAERKGRFIMRAHQTFRVLLNQPVFKRMQVGDREGREPQGKTFSLAVIEQGRPTPHLLKLGDEAEAKRLYHEVMKLQQDLETQA
ncbi:MAG: hypothetical protein Q9166_003393 [cf. Caloplaca sp. 2 TL-2023]